MTPRAYTIFPAALASAVLVFAGPIVSARADTTAIATRAPIPSLAPLIDRVTPAVVSVVVKKSMAANAEGQQGSPSNDPSLRHFFGNPDGEGQAQPQPQEVTGAGSGVIIDADKGYILTNYHVVDHAKDIMVTLKDRREFPAKVLGSDEGTDIALIQIKADGLKSIPVSDSHELRVGDYVVAVGNPFGLGQTVTSGIVSALGRSGLNIEGYEDFIQTDASINPGNSGGALVNLRGELVGINTAILGPSGGNIGIGFAVPTAMTKSVTEQILKYGEVKRGRIGVQIANMTPGLASNLGVDANIGALIERVEPGSSADTAGVKTGDIVLSLDSQLVASASDFRNRIGLMPVGTQVELGLLRDGKKQNVKLAVAAPSKNDVVAAVETQPALEGANLSAAQDKNGVTVVSVEQNSPAWQAGLRTNDEIVAINRKPVRDMEALNTALKSSRHPALFVRRQGETLVVVI